MTGKTKANYLSALVKQSQVSDAVFRLVTVFLLYENLGIAKFTQAELGEKLGWSVKSMDRALRESERLCLISRHRYAQGKANGYSLNVAKLREIYFNETHGYLSFSNQGKVS